MKLFIKFTYTLLSILLGVTIITACNTTNDFDYKPGNLSVGFTLRSAQHPIIFENVEGKASLPIGFFANEAPSQPVSLNYTITSSTAQAGVQYADPNNGSITIQPGEDRFYTFDIDVLKAGYVEGESYRTQVDTLTVTFSPTQESAAVGSIGSSTVTLIVFAQCNFTPAIFTGTATMNDPFGDVSEYPVTISEVDATTLRVTGYHAQTSGPTEYAFNLTVNPASGAVNVARQIYTQDDLYDLGYTNWAVAGNGTLDICNKILRLNLTNSVDQGGYGAAAYVITW